MTYSFHPEARNELFATINYYETAKKGLGSDFLNQIEQAIKRIIILPKAWSILDTNIRRCLVNRFPFGIIYGINNDDIYILAIMNLCREPNYWKTRI